jgi:2-isopropylmalate synthase
MRHQRKEVMFDAEHFFDGYKANPGYALACVEAALEAGARWVVLCDTNGGTLPHEIERIVGEVASASRRARSASTPTTTPRTPSPTAGRGRAGARQVQGTLNGLGERCGNANLISLIPTLKLKIGYETGVTDAACCRLTHVSRAARRAAQPRPGPRRRLCRRVAFAHKGGLHVSAVAKDPRFYEHIDPALVGNRRHIVVSDQAGRANILARFARDRHRDRPGDPRSAPGRARSRRASSRAIAYDGAEASFELLARGARAACRTTSALELSRHRRAPLERARRAGHALRGDDQGGGRRQRFMTVADGNGPVNALDTRAAQGPGAAYPQLETCASSTTRCAS